MIYFSGFHWPPLLISVAHYKADETVMFNCKNKKILQVYNFIQSNMLFREGRHQKVLIGMKKGVIHLLPKTSGILGQLIS